MTLWKRVLSLAVMCGLFLSLFAAMPLMPSAQTEATNLIEGKATQWFTKVSGNAAALPAVTETTFASGENVGKATDGAKTASGGFTGNDMFKLAPVDGSDSVGFKIDLQAPYSLTEFKLTMTNDTGWKLGYRAAKGMVYTSENGTDWDAGVAFDNSAQEVEISVTLAAKARYVMVVITNPSAIQFNGAVRIYETELYGTELPVTVTFDYSGADGGELTELTRDVEKNGEVGTLPAPTKTGETFLGWFDRSGAMWDATTVVTENVTLTAKFGSNLIAGKATAWFTKAYGNGADLPTVTETTFASGENVGKATDGAKTASGGFTGNDMFKLAPVDGSDSVGFKIDLQTVYSLSVFKLTMTNDTNDWKLGYRAAKGMVYTSENGTDWDAGVAFDNSAKEIEISVALTAKARYVLVMITNPSAIQYSGAVRIYETELYGAPVTYAVTFENCDLAARTLKDGDTLDLSAETPVKDGCWFTGYFTDAACTVPFANGAAIEADTTLYAGWQAVENQTAVVAVQVRLRGAEGLRYISQVDMAAFEAIQAIDPQAECGTLVEKRSFVTGSFDLAGCAVQGSTRRRVPAEKTLTAGVDYIADGTLKYTAVVISIPEKHFGSDIAARAYVTYTDASGIRREYYSNEGETECYATNLKAAAQLTLTQYESSLSDAEKARLNAIMAVESV